MSTNRVTQFGDKGSARDDRTTQQFEKDFNTTDLSFGDPIFNESDCFVGEITEVFTGAEEPRYEWKIVFPNNDTGEDTVTYDQSFKTSVLNGTNKGFLPHLIELNREFSSDDPTYEVGDKVIAFKIIDKAGVDQYFCLPKFSHLVVEYCQPNDVTPVADGDYIVVDVTTAAGSDISSPKEVINILGQTDREEVLFTEFGWTSGTTLIFLRFKETLTHEATVMSGVLLGNFPQAAAPEEEELVPDPSGGEEYMVLRLDDTLTPIWDWVRAHG